MSYNQSEVYIYIIWSAVISIVGYGKILSNTSWGMLNAVRCGKVIGVMKIQYYSSGVPYYSEMDGWMVTMGVGNIMNRIAGSVGIMSDY